VLDTRMYIQAAVYAEQADGFNACGRQAFRIAQTYTAKGETEQALLLLEHAHMDMTAARWFTHMLFHAMAQSGITFDAFPVPEYQEGCDTQ
jgi:hypothetical protein